MNEQTKLKITKSSRGGRGWIKLTRISNRTTGRGGGGGRGRGAVRGNIHNNNDPYKSNVRPYKPKSIAMNNNNNNEPVRKPAVNDAIMTNNNKNKAANSKITKQNKSMSSNESVNKPAINNKIITTNKKNVEPQKAKSNNAKNANKGKNKKKYQTNRPKPSQLNLCDFINIPQYKKKKPAKKKLTVNQKVFKLEKAFKIKEELQKHPYIVKQEYRKKLNQKKAATATALNSDDNQTKNNIIKIEKTLKTDNNESKNNIVKIEKKTSKFKATSQKKHIKKGRIHKDVVNVVEFLVNAVCGNEINDINMNDNYKLNKKLKNKNVRLRKKEMEKLKKLQPNLISERNKLKDYHCGLHGEIMKYGEIRSYSNHLTSIELHDRVGFLLTKLSILRQRERDKIRENEFLKLKEHKFFLCGMKECLKSLRRRRADPQYVNVIGVIMSPQMERLPESSGLDAMISEIEYLCLERELEIIYALNRKQLNYILKLRPWQGNVSCVTLLDVDIYNETWKRIIQIKQALNEQYLMWQYDFIPIFRAVSAKPRFVPMYEQEKELEKKKKMEKEKKKEIEMEKKREIEKKKEIEIEKKKQEIAVEKEEKIQIINMVKGKDKDKDYKKIKGSKLSAKAVPFDPMQTNLNWQPMQQQPNINNLANINQFQMNNISFTHMPFTSMNMTLANNPYINNKPTKK